MTSFEADRLQLFAGYGFEGASRWLGADGSKPTYVIERKGSSTSKRGGRASLRNRVGFCDHGSESPIDDARRTGRTGRPRRHTTTAIVAAPPR